MSDYTVVELTPEVITMTLPRNERKERLIQRYREGRLSEHSLYLRMASLALEGKEVCHIRAE